MINKVKVVNSYGEELTMTLKEPQNSGYAITEITGLEPTEVDIKQTQFVSGRKYKYNAGFHKYREIGFSFLYYEDNCLLMDVEQLRNNLYKYFRTNDKIILYFEKDDVQYSIEGYVSKHEAQIWSNACGAKVNVLCPDPWFRKNDIKYLDTTENEDNNDCKIIYQGDISTGFKLTITTPISTYSGSELILSAEHVLTGAIRYFTLNIPNMSTSERLVIDLMSDVITVYTMLNNDQSYIINRNGWIDSTTISKRQEIPELFPGVNLIGLSSEEDLTYAVQYNTLYRGL